MLWAMAKVAWLATLMDDHYSSFDEDGGWMSHPKIVFWDVT